MIEVAFPLRLVSEANAHGHWRERQRRAKAQREAVAWHLTRFAPPPAPLAVEIVRVAPRSLDSDNAVISAKHVRDSIATWLGIDDRSPLVVWSVRQERGAPHAYAVRIRIAPLHPVPAEVTP